MNLGSLRSLGKEGHGSSLTHHQVNIGGDRVESNDGRVTAVRVRVGREVGKVILRTEEAGLLDIVQEPVVKKGGRQL